MASQKPHDYQPLEVPFREKETFSDQDSEDEPFIRSAHLARSSSLKCSLPWILCAIFAISSSILLFLLLRQTKQLKSQPIYKSEFLDPATIPLEQVTFSGSPQFSLDGTMSAKPFNTSAPWPENVHYFGEPSPEIDKNWNELIGNRYFSISEEEAKSVWGDSYIDFVDQLQGGYTAGLDVFHTLHCVNAIRKALYPEYYQKDASAHNGIPHVDHCLNAIRQYVQCAGITTLIPTRFHEGIKRNYIDSDQTHTCRSFTYLREWTTSRKAGASSYVPRDRSNVDPWKNKLAEDNMAQIAAHREGTLP